MNSNKISNSIADISVRKTAIVAGFLYFIYLIIQIVGDSFGYSKFIVWGDAVATANNIMVSTWLFRISFISDIIAAVFFLLAA